MHFKPILFATLLMVFLASLGDSAVLRAAAEGSEMTPEKENPLLDTWDTPYGVPPFDLISSADYLPALRQGMREQAAEIEAIAASSEAPSFANTIEALERSGRTLARVARVFYALDSAHADATIRETSKTIAPEYAAHRDNISLNNALFDRISQVNEQRGQLDLTPEQEKLLEETYKQFERSGANLVASAQHRLREINTELATLSAQFQENLLEAVNAYELLITDPADLGDLPKSLVAGAAEEAQRRGHEGDYWSFTLQRPSFEPFLQYSPNRQLRRQIFEAYATLGDGDNETDNKQIVTRMVALRAERAALLGFDSHAHFVLADNMAETPDNVYRFLDQIWKPALRVSIEEREEREALMRADGIDDKLRAWDWRYYTEKVRQAEYDFDEEDLRPYFEVSAVRDGVFSLAGKLFGLKFERRDDLPRWHTDQEVFEVRDIGGAHLAVIYLDYFARSTKRAGAWMNELRTQRKLDAETRPIVTNNFNFPAPTKDAPSLLSLSEAETFLHEFGHALHGMLSDVTYASLAGTSTPRDFVEFPSQIMENWLREPEVLRLFAKHYQTGEPIPEELIDKIVASAKFDQGFHTVEYLAAAYLDMAYHMLDSTEPVEPRSFESAAMTDIGLIDEIIPRYRSSYFAHVFSGGYSAGYYSYIWSEVLDADAFQAFRESDLFDQEIAERYRSEVLSKGGTRPGMELYANFRGREPAVDPLLERRGLN